MKENQPRYKCYHALFPEGSLLEEFRQGLLLGLLLFTSSLITLKLTAPAGLETVFFWLIPILCGYLAAGCLIHFFRSLLSLLDTRLFLGAAGLAWVSSAAAVFAVLTLVLPGFARMMLLANGALLLFLWEVEYYQLKRAAKELNGSTAGRTLIVDLEVNPGTEETFFAVLESYCRKNSVSLEYVKRAVPAEVKLDGRLHTVSVSYYYAYGGPVWYMEIQEII